MSVIDDEFSVRFALETLRGEIEAFKKEIPLHSGICKETLIEGLRQLERGLLLIENGYDVSHNITNVARLKQRERV